MKKNEPFSFQARANSFRFAWNGFKSFLRTEHNAWIHLVGTVVVIALAIVTRVSRIEAILLVIVTGLVWMAELINSAVEKISNMISLEQREDIRYVKDVAAAFVLVSAIIAFTTGCIIFIPKF